MQTTMITGVTELSDLPRELDPFECDWPWQGWVEPRAQAVLESIERMPDFEADVARALAIFDE